VAKAKTHEKKVPQDPAAERALLGSIFLDPGSLDRVIESGVLGEHFSQPSHRVIFDTFLSLNNAGTAVDVVTVSGQLNTGGQLDQIGGFPYLNGLAGAVPSVANLDHYISVVREKALLRGLLHVTQGISERVLTEPEGAEVALGEAESKLQALREGNDSSALARLGDVAEQVYDQMRQRAESPDDVTGVSTGFRELDVLTSGFHPGDLVICAARPAMGKTAFALNIVAHAALRAGTTCAFFSLEMPKEQLAQRILTSESRVSGQRIRTGKLLQDDWAPLLRATEAVDRAAVYIDDKPAVTVQHIRARCKRLQNQHGLGLVAIDYLQLMRGDSDSRREGRQVEIASISMGLKALAKEFGVPVLALSQLNRGVEQRADKRPLMSDLRESGAIEQDADVIMFLYRDEYYYPDKPENKGLAEVLVRKQRNGSTGELKLAFRGEFARFENLEPGFG
jgi:replicative DNA helicase